MLCCVCYWPFSAYCLGPESVWGSPEIAPMVINRNIVAFSLSTAWPEMNPEIKMIGDPNTQHQIKKASFCKVLLRSVKIKKYDSFFG